MTKGKSTQIVYIAILLFFLFPSFGSSQLLQHQANFTKIDSLRGFLYPARASFNALFYRLHTNFDLENQSISGRVDMQFAALEPIDSIQIDLDSPLMLDSVYFQNKKIHFERFQTHAYLYFPQKIAKNDTAEVKMYYRGSPRKAKNAPWDGGFVWKKDQKGRIWAGVACEGDGASIWWPCKDHWHDEPEKGVEMNYTVPNPYVAVGNGKLTKIDNTTHEDKITYTWTVTNPINLYNVNFTIGQFVNFSGQHSSQNLYKKGAHQGNSLLLDYYVLDYNLEKAKKHFEVVPNMLSCFENVLGSFPFIADGYKLVETPYLGMEHQCAIAYGNQYKMGYLGNTDYTAGHLFDYIIIHETAHEWFGNNITASDPADMWIHEAYTTYMEGMYVECQSGYQAALDYVNHHKEGVRNQRPIRGVYGVAKEGDGDMYHKGALILNTLRHQFPSDSLWKKSLKMLNDTFYHQTISYKEIVRFYSKLLGSNYEPFFEQYVMNEFIPELTISDNKKSKTLEMKWTKAINEFGLKLPFKIDSTEKPIYLKEGQTLKISYKKDWTFDDQKVYLIFKTL